MCWGLEGYRTNHCGFTDKLQPKKRGNRKLRLEIVTGSISKECGTRQLFTKTNPIFPSPRPGSVPGAPCGCIPGLHLSMSARLPPALWEARGRSFGSGRWRSAPGPGQEPLPGRTGPQAGPSVKPVIETGNGPALPWGSIDPAPGKRRQRWLLQHSRFLQC